MAGTTLIQTDLNMNSASRITNLLDGTDPQHPATVAQLNAAIEGLSPKDSARVSTQGNLNLASPGASIDGITMATNDRVLVRSQTTSEDNGIYIWNGAATPMTRSPDASTFSELEQAVVSVEEGTDENTTWRQTEVNGVLGSDPIVFISFGTSAPAASTTVAGLIEIATQVEVDAGSDAVRAVTPATLAGSTYVAKRYSATFGDGSSTSYVITHNLNTRDVVCAIYLAASTYDEVLCEIEHTSVNSVTVLTNSAPSTNQYRITVIG